MDDVGGGMFQISTQHQQSQVQKLAPFLGLLRSFSAGGMAVAQIRYSC